jgi:Ca2+-binding RTX toxin-like protein
MPAVISPGFTLFDIDPNSTSDTLADAVTLQDGRIVLVAEPLGSTADVRLRIFEADGDPSTMVQTVNTTMFGSQSDAKVTQLANGNIVVVWTDNSETTPDFSGETVRMQVFNSAGDRIGGEITVPTVTDDDQRVETIVALNNGRFAVVWDDLSQSSAFPTGKFRIYNSDGTPASGEVVIPALSPENREGHVTADGAGGLVVAGIISAGGNRVMLQRFNANGNLNGDAIEVSGPVNNLSDAKVAVLANGNYVVTWTDGSNTPPFNKGPVVYGQIIDAAGNKVGGIFTASDDIFSEHRQSEVTALADGKFAVTWRMEPDNDFLSYKIVTRIFNADGTADSDVTVVYDNAAFYSNIRNFAGLRSVTEMADGRLLYTFNALNPDGTATAATRIVDPREGLNVTLTAGADLRSGTDFADVMRGLGGNDTLYGQGGNDVLYGGEGNDILYGGAGADLIDGGAGARDRVMYSDSATGLRVDLQAPATNTGIAAGDSFVGIEDLDGSNNADSLLGNAVANIISGADGHDLLVGRGGADSLYGGLGNDILLGGDGADRLVGGDGFDLAQYSGSAVGLTVDLLNAAANTGEAVGDTFLGIEGLVGSSFNDVLRGDAAANILSGGDGNDLLVGRGGADSLFGGLGSDTMAGGAGADRYIGGGGADMVAYWDATAGVFTDMWNGALGTGDAAGDVMLYIRDVAGTSFNDTIRATNDANQVFGNAGADLLLGRGGDDTLNGGDGADRLFGQLGNDILTGGAGADFFYFTEALGPTNVDQITDFTAVDDTLLLENAIFTALTATGALAGTAFATGAAATTAAHRVIYNSATGQLLYDADGNGAGAAVHFATLSTGLAVTAADFVVV